MQGISGIFNIAKAALSAQQIAMEVTAHNISNVNTPGYTRQSASLKSAIPLTQGSLKIGMGVHIASVIQAFDQYSTRTILQNTSTQAQNEAKASVLSYLETIFNETTDRSLSQTVSEFWNAWQDLANNPGGIPERTALLEKAETLCKNFNAISSDLHQITGNMNTNLGIAVGDINQISKEIAFLNENIVAAESDGTTANDLRDQRNNLLEKLSGLIGNVSLEDRTGAVTVMTSSGMLLVDGVDYWELSSSGNNIYYNNIPRDISRDLTGGKIGGWLDVRDEIVPQYIADIDELAGTFIHDVNSLHLTGYTLSGDTGKYFFENFQTAPDVPNTGDYQNAASYIRLSSDVLGTPENIAAGGLSGDPGDNENALAILGIQTDDTIQIRKWAYSDRGQTVSSSLQTETPDDFFRTLTGEIGILTDEINQNVDFSQSILDRLGELRDSVSGVNIDEEMMEMLKIQRAHEAAAKLITTADEMLQSLLQMR